MKQINRNITLFVIILGLAISTKVENTFTPAEFTREDGGRLICKKITSFKTEKGTGKYILSAKSIMPKQSKETDKEERKNESGNGVEVQFELFIIDEKIDEAVKERSSCSELRNNSEYHLLLFFGMKNNEGTYSESRFGQLTNTGDPKTFNFYFCDCQNFMNHVNLLKKDPELSIKYEIILNSEQIAHLGAEEQLILPVVIFLLVAYSILLTAGICKIMKYYEKNDKMDIPLLFLNIDILCQIIGLVFKLFHNIVFMVNGVDVSFLEIIARLFNISSDMALSFLLIALVKGWGIEGEKMHIIGTKSMISGFSLMALRYFWTVMSLIGSEKENVYHMYQGWYGKLEIATMIILLSWFLYEHSKSELQQSKKFKKFIITSRIMGILMFLIKPAVIFVIVTYYSNVVNQHVLLIFISILGHLINSSIFQYILTGKKGVYMMISFSNRIELEGDVKSG